MKKFWELVQSSVIVQSLVTLIFTCVIAYAVVTDHPVPPEVWGAYGAVLGYWFGAKNQYAARETARTIAREFKEDKKL